MKYTCNFRVVKKNFRKIHLTAVSPVIYAVSMFGAKLRELRLAAGLTRKELAAAAELVERTLEGIEQGRHGPNWDTACALADVLEVSLDRFRDPVIPTQAPRGRPKKKAT